MTTNNVLEVETKCLKYAVKFLIVFDFLSEIKLNLDF